jgi:hypothetical protein
MRASAGSARIGFYCGPTLWPTFTAHQRRSHAIGRLRAPLDNALVDALTCLRKRQLDESATTCSAYRAGLASLGCTRAVST